MVQSMVCSVCEGIIARAIPGTVFDVTDCGWKCPHCKEYWLSDDGWTEIGNLLIPFRGEQRWTCNTGRYI